MANFDVVKVKYSQSLFDFKLQKKWTEECMLFGKDTRDLSQACTYRNQWSEGKDKKILLWGDSHADAYQLAIEEALKDSSYKLVSMTAASCPPWLGLNILDFNNGVNCDERNRKILEQLNLSNDYEAIVLIGAWFVYSHTSVRPLEHVESGQLFLPEEYELAGLIRDSLVTLVDELIKQGKPIVFVSGNPVFQKNVVDSIERLAARDSKMSVNISREKLANQSAKFDSIVEFIKDKYAGRIKFVEPVNVLCTPDCIGAEFDETSQTIKAYYYDNHHLSVEGARRIVPSIVSALGVGFPSN